MKIDLKYLSPACRWSLTIASQPLYFYYLQWVARSGKISFCNRERKKNLINCDESSRSIGTNGPWSDEMKKWKEIHINVQLFLTWDRKLLNDLTIILIYFFFFPKIISNREDLFLANSSRR